MSALVVTGRDGRPDLRRIRHVITVVLVAVAVVAPLGLSDFQKTLAARSAVAAVFVLSLVVLTGMVGQTSFCQYSFGAMGAFTVGALTQAHHWNFWIAMPFGVAFAVVVGAAVGIPALRLSGLFLAILTVAVALAVDRWLLSSGTWNSFSGGVTPWRVARPTVFGISLEGPYAFYLFCLAVFLIATLVVWNLRTGKTGRVLRAVRDSEVAASTAGLNLTAWKLAAFGLGAGLAGLAGALQALADTSVSPGAYDFQHSVQLAALVTVWGVRSVASAGFAGVFLWFGPEILKHTPIAGEWFPAVLGGLLIAQLVFNPDGIVTTIERDGRRLILRVLGRSDAAEPPNQSPPPLPAVALDDVEPGADADLETAELEKASG